MFVEEIGEIASLLEFMCCVYFLPAALPFDQGLQDVPPRVQCVPRGEEVELLCEYPPGNLRELYSVQWRFREEGNDALIVPPGFGPNGAPLPPGSSCQLMKTHLP